MTNEEYLQLINEDPTGVLTNDDGYQYQPVSHLREEMDRIYSGDWDFDLDREEVGKSMIIGKGHIVYAHPVSGRLVKRSGTASVPFTPKGLQMDYPKMEAMVMMSAIRKIGKRFGRDLNKRKEDEPVPIIPVELTPDGVLDDEAKNLFTEEKEKLRAFQYYEEAEEFRKTCTFGMRPEMKAIANIKPRKNS